MRACLLALLLAGCGSGAVSDPASNPAPVATPLAVSPPSATAHPGLPTVFTFTGGSGLALISSDNQAVIPNVSSSGSGFVVVPGPVQTSTLVHLTVQDSTGKVTIPITVEPLTVAPLTVQPGTINFQGLSATACAFNTSADVVVYGGLPPYIVTQTPAFTTSATVLSSNPATFKVTAIGCATNDTLAVVDARGTSASVKLTNTPSTLPTTPLPAFVLSPDVVTLVGCSDVATVALAGGTGSYFAASGNSGIYAYTQGHVGYIQRLVGTASAPSPVQVGFSDGISVIPVTVTLQVGAQGKC